MEYFQKFIPATIGVFVIYATAWSQPAERMPVGKWKVCTTLTTDKIPPCETASFVTYDFHEDGTYSDSREYIYNGKTYPYYGTWQYDGNTLTVETANIHENMYTGPLEFSVVWVSDTVFYAAGREGENGPMVYTYFKKVE